MEVDKADTKDLSKLNKIALDGCRDVRLRTKNREGGREKLEWEEAKLQDIIQKL